LSFASGPCLDNVQLGSFFEYGPWALLMQEKSSPPPLQQPRILNYFCNLFLLWFFHHSTLTPTWLWPIVTLAAYLRERG